ncbi:MAG: competence protein ComJ [Planctomycetes bacterium]|nr:competence protein ComJ [Planctomycetota bacterium]
MSIKMILSPPLYFSYSQFMVYDSAVTLPGCAWTDAHSAQGFARRKSAVCFNSILEFGHADVTATQGLYQPNKKYERVIAVPFTVESSKVIVEGPEEFDVGRTIALEAGNFRLVAAQYVVDDSQQKIDLYFEPRHEPLQSSEILVADELLDPPVPLVEIAEIARPHDSLAI